VLSGFNMELEATTGAGAGLNMYVTLWLDVHSFGWS